KSAAHASGSKRRRDLLRAREILAGHALREPIRQLRTGGLLEPDAGLLPVLLDAFEPLRDRERGLAVLAADDRAVLALAVELHRLERLEVELEFGASASLDVVESAILDAAHVLDRLEHAAVDTLHLECFEVAVRLGDLRLFLAGRCRECRRVVVAHP